MITLARGRDITAPILLCGGPLAFIPALRQSFAEYLNLSLEKDFILPEKSNLIPAWGAALTGTAQTVDISVLIERLEKGTNRVSYLGSKLSPIFKDEQEYEQWKKRLGKNGIQRTKLKPGFQQSTIGIDSGSTTTKIVVLDESDRILYSYYHYNDGDPIKAVVTGLQKLEEECRKQGTVLQIKGGCSTGYGEDLIKSGIPDGCRYY